MPRNGSGVYSPPAGTTAVPNTTIESARFNAYHQDVTADLNAARPITAGGTGATNADAAAKALGLVSAKDLAGVNTVAGSANAIEITTDRVYTAYANTIVLAFKASADIAAGGTTIDLDGLGAKAVRKVAASGDVDVNLGDIIEGGIYTVRYDTAADGGDGGFILLNSSAGGENALQVGDFFSTARSLGSDWLRRDGALYDSADYPELAAILPSLPDGVSWSTISTGITGAVMDVVADDGQFLAVSNNGDDTNVYTSFSGNTWAVVALIENFAPYRVVAGNGIYLQVDGFGKGAVSNDGVNWGAPFTIVSGDEVNLAVTFGNGLFVIVGSDGTNGMIKTSPDGITWTSRTSGTTETLWGIRYLNGNFIALGTNGTILTSADGTSWTSRTSGTTETLFDAAYGEGTYVVVGGTSILGTGVIFTSTNLTSWTPRSSGSAGQFKSVTYSSSGFMAVGRSGSVRISSDGASWDASAAGTSAALEHAIFDPARPERYLVPAGSSLLEGIRTLPTQFRVPDDAPDYGWIKAVS